MSNSEIKDKRLDLVRGSLVGGAAGSDTVKCSLLDLNSTNRGVNRPTMWTVAGPRPKVLC